MSDPARDDGETVQPMVCPDCGAPVEPGHEVCRDCGYVLREAPKGGALLVLGHRAAWLFGAVYLLAALGLATGRPTAFGSAVAFAAGGVFLLPPTRRLIAEVADVEFARWQVVVVAIAVFFVAWGLLPEQPPLIGSTEERAL